MNMRITRKLAACIGLSALVFAQLAVSAYACPVLAQTIEAAQPANATAPPCHDMDRVDRDQPALCQVHCQDSLQNVNDVQPAFALSGFVTGFIVMIDSAAQKPLPVRPASPSLLHSTSPPLSIRNCCFRI
jgi:hypothetical protein